MIQTNAQNGPQLRVLFETLYLLTEIFHDLTCHDIPDFFVTHLKEFLGLLHKYMIYDNPLLQGDVSEPWRLYEWIFFPRHANHVSQYRC